MTAQRVLAAEAISVNFGGVQALAEVSVRLEVGEVLGLIGPNGSGKTTFINVITGFQRPRSGKVQLDARDVTSFKPRQLSRMGIGRTFQSIRLFSDMTVHDNVLAGALGSGLRRRKARARTDEIISTTGLEEIAAARAGTLSYGVMRRVALARTLVSAPHFVILDEPAAGLNEEESDLLVALLLLARELFGSAIMIVEHDMRVIMTICSRVQVLDAGKTIASGTPAEIQADSLVREAYLGVDA